MSKKKQSSDEEIWSKRFDEDQDDLEYVSRSERSQGNRDRDDKMSPILTGTVIFLAVLILATIFYYVWYTNRPSNQPDIAAEDDMEIVAEDQVKEEPEEEEDAETDQEPDSEEPVESEPEESETSPEPEVEPEPETVTEPEATPEPETTPEPAPAPAAPEAELETEPILPPTVEGNTYTVQAGDNMYRIALNHGMTTQELMALNNLSSETVYVGQVLKVK